MEQKKQRFEVLDALRGLCALVVVALHICEAHNMWTSLPHSHMAVEYFFMLTGFTFILAYDKRWGAGGLTVAKFLWKRFLRLWPLILIGSFVGLMLFFWSPERFYTRTPHDVTGQVGRFLRSLTMIPLPTKTDYMTPMQPQTWTLLYIIYANILYAFVLRHLRKVGVAVGLVLAAAYSVWATSTFGVMAYGWEWDATHVTVATARMAFPIFLGMFVAQHGWKLSFRGAGLVAALLLGGMLVSTVGVGTPAACWYELGYLFVGMPLVLLCGEGGAIPEGRFAAFCRFMGRYSFPLYATHYPFTQLFRLWRVAHPDALAPTHTAALVALLVAIFATAYLAMRGADLFVRLFGRRP